MPNTTNITAQTLPEIIADQAGRRPASAFLLAPGRPFLTFRELADVVWGVRRSLAALGIGRADRVAIVVQDSPEMASAFLATAAHCCAAPLNPALGDEELDFRLSDLNVSAVILPEKENEVARNVATRLGITVLDLVANPENPAGAIAVRGDEAKTIAAMPESPRCDDIALVLHTSGTTARPKIVPLTQGNLLTSARAVAASLALTERDRSLSVMPLFHIHGLVADILAPLHSGGSVVRPPGFSPDSFFDCVTDYRPSWYTAVPTIHHAILMAGRHRAPPVEGHRFRFVRSSSSPMPPQLMKELSDFFGAPVVEAYGMTEASHQIATNSVTPGEQRPGSVGRPAGTEVSIVDESGNAVPAGELGEIAIRGHNVMGGYEGNAAINENAFIGDWFRTGDEGRLDESGFLYLTDRLKEIINRGGEKVSPREVDDILSEHPAVRQAVTFAVSHETLGEDVLAAVVLDPDSGVNDAMLRSYLFDRVADFKVPTRILLVDAIPVSPTGKLQRFAMAEKLGGALEVAFDAPGSRVETFVAELVSEITGQKRVGAQDNFFALGGDSIRGFQLVSRIHAALQIELSPVVVFRHPTIRELAREVERAAEEVFGGPLEDLLAEVEALSDEEAESILRADDANRAGAL